jgi:hexokinase
MTVYVVQEVTKFNISGAQKYGELKVVLPPGNMSFSTDATYKKAAENLRTFKKEDYLLLIGDPIAMGICFSIALALSKGNLKLLKWDKQTMSYLSLSVNINNVLGERND